MNNLYKNIRSRRLALGMTQDELARLTGYKDRSMIARIERGDVDLPQSKVVMFTDFWLLRDKMAYCDIAFVYKVF